MTWYHGTNQPTNQPKHQPAKVPTNQPTNLVTTTPVYFNEQVPHTVIASLKLTNNEKALYMCLLYHFREKTTCNPGYMTLVREANIGSNGILSLALKKLEWKKIITIHHSKQVDLPNVYVKRKLGEVARRKLGTSDTVKLEKFEMIPHAVITSTALTNDAKILYCILQYHARRKTSCFAGVEVLCKEAQISRGTLTRCIRQLELTGLITRSIRRSSHQSTIYQLNPITRTTYKLLKQNSNDLLATIKREENISKIIRLEKRMANIREIRYQIRKSVKVCFYAVLTSLWTKNTAIVKREPVNYVKRVLHETFIFIFLHLQKSIEYALLLKSVEVQFDPKKYISPTENIYTSSKINMNSSMIKKNENEKKQERKNSLEQFKPKLPESLQKQLDALKMNQMGEEVTIATTVIQEQNETESVKGLTKLDEMTASIETLYADEEHAKENRTRTRNLFQKVQGRQIDEAQFLEQMMTVKALMKERVGEGKWIKNRMAYFYAMLENRFFPKESSENKHRLFTNMFVKMKTT